MGRSKRRPSLRAMRSQCAELAKQAATLADQLAAYADDASRLLHGDPDPVKRKPGRPPGRPPGKKRAKTSAERVASSITTVVDGLKIARWVERECPPGRPVFVQMLVTDAEKQGATTRMKGGMQRLIRQIVTKSKDLEWVDPEQRTRFRNTREK